MALLFIDGFDHYTALTEKYDLVATPPLEAEIITTDGRFTNGALEISDNNIGEIVKFVTTSDEIIVGLAVKFDGINVWIMRFQDGVGNTICTFEAEGTGGKVWRGDFDSGTLLGSFVSGFTTATWQYLEVRIKRNATLGEVEVRINESAVLSLTNQNTGATNFSRIFLRTTAQNGGSVLLDDMYILNTVGAAPQNTFIGDVRVTALRPKANGNTNNFTPTGASNNFEAVDDALADQDATFVEAGQLGAKDDYNNKDFADLGISPGTIYGVQVVNSAKKTDAGTLKYKNQMVIAGSLFDDGTEITATATDYKMTTFIRDTDPSDSAAWTESKVAAVGSGFEITFREV